jgi:hypothetical protein
MVVADGDIVHVIVVVVEVADVGRQHPPRPQVVRQVHGRVRRRGCARGVAAAVCTASLKVGAMCVRDGLKLGRCFRDSPSLPILQTLA